MIVGVVSSFFVRQVKVWWGEAMDPKEGNICSSAPSTVATWFNIRIAAEGWEEGAMKDLKGLTLK